MTGNHLFMLVKSVLMEPQHSTTGLNGWLSFGFLLVFASPKAPGELANKAQLSLLHICCHRIALHDGGKAALRRKR